MVFMDEFLFFDPRALPVILPTLANGAALVLTSSIAPNVADDLMRMLDVRYSDGTRVVNVLNWIVSCRTCRKRNRADRCTHVVRRPQHFQKFSDKERLQALMSVFSGAYEREMLNAPDEPTRKPAFKGELVDWLMQSPEAVYRSSDYMGAFFISVDPNGGSFSSDMVVTSCAYKLIKGAIHTIMLGFESCNLCDNIKVGELVASHVMAVRRLPGFEHAMGVLVIESNLHGANVAIPQYLHDANIANVVAMRDDKATHNGSEMRPGTRTNEENKFTMIEMLQKRLETRSLMVHQNFVVSQPDYSNYTDPEHEMFEELRKFTEVTKVNARDPTVRARKTYTGKLNGGKDDFVMALSSNIYHHAKFLTDRKYSVYHKRVVG